jgi:thiamine-phosphate pyrophosphorylase
MPTPRLFLVAPENIPAAQLLSCATAAALAGDCASIVVDAGISSETITALQNQGLAVLTRNTANPAADGLQVQAETVDVAAFRKSLGKTTMIGAYCAASRHLAMEAAEQGADYVAFSQTQQTKGEPLISWWIDLFEIPVVAYDPVDTEALDILLPQNPDFIRPLDVMWESPASATATITALSQKLTP